MIRALIIFAAFFMFVMGDRAYAASLTITRASMTGEDWFGLACLAVMGLLIWLYAIVTYPRKTEQEYREERFGPETTREQRMRNAEGQN